MDINENDLNSKRKESLLFFSFYLIF